MEGQWSHSMMPELQAWRRGFVPLESYSFGMSIVEPPASQTLGKEAAWRPSLNLSASDFGRHGVQKVTFCISS